MDTAEESGKVMDSNGDELLDGDDVTVIKDLKVKGSSMVVKRGTRVCGFDLKKMILHMYGPGLMDKQYF